MEHRCGKDRRAVKVKAWLAISVLQTDAAGVTCRSRWESKGGTADDQRARTRLSAQLQVDEVAPTYASRVKPHAWASRPVHLASANLIEELEYTRDLTWPPVESNQSTRLGPSAPGAHGRRRESTCEAELEDTEASESHMEHESLSVNCLGGDSATCPSVLIERCRNGETHGRTMY